MADAIMQSLNEYAETTSLGVKAAVKKTGTQVKKQISSTAPTDTGAYAKSWATKNTRENFHALEVMNWRSAMKKITWYNKYSSIEL